MTNISRLKILKPLIISTHRLNICFYLYTIESNKRVLSLSSSLTYCNT